MPFHPNIQSTRREFKLSSHTPAACLVTAECSPSPPSSFLMFVLCPPLGVFHETGATNSFTISNEPLTQDLGLFRQGSENFSLLLHLLFYFCSDTIPNIAKREGRARRFQPVLRNSHDSVIGQFMEWDELGPNFTNLLLFHFPIIRWRDGSHDLKKKNQKPTRNFNLFFFLPFCCLKCLIHNSFLSYFHLPYLVNIF